MRTMVLTLKSLRTWGVVSLVEELFLALHFRYRLRSRPEVCELPRAFSPFWTSRTLHWSKSSSQQLQIRPTPALETGPRVTRVFVRPESCMAQEEGSVKTPPSLALDRLRTRRSWSRKKVRNNRVLAPALVLCLAWGRILEVPVRAIRPSPSLS